MKTQPSCPFSLSNARCIFRRSKVDIAFLISWSFFTQGAVCMNKTSGSTSDNVIGVIMATHGPLPFFWPARGRAESGWEKCGFRSGRTGRMRTERPFCYLVPQLFAGSIQTTWGAEGDEFGRIARPFYISWFFHIICISDGHLPWLLALSLCHIGLSLTRRLGHF